MADHYPKDCDNDQDNDHYLVEFLEKYHEYRQLDGSNTNPVHKEYGKAGLPFRRIAPAEYNDGLNEPGGQKRASARKVSNLLCAQPNAQPNKHGCSNMTWLYGQFVDHTITLTLDGGEAFPIKVPNGDPHFDPNSDGNKEINLTRSQHVAGQDSAREQFNTLSPLLDASMVYGHNEERNKHIRAFKDGELLVSEGYMLPVYTGQGANAGNSPHMAYFAGDVRANEHLGLTALHTLFVRDHNRWAVKIKALRPKWNDEQIYQKAKILVEAEIQQICYSEFLPVILGRGTLRPYEGFQPDVNPQLANEFSAAAYRFGHSMVSGDLYEPYQLRDAYFSSHILANEGGIDSPLKQMAARYAQDVDGGLVDDLRNLLFGPPGAGGHDLAALNIQRGRDHGLAHYNAVRVKVGLPPIQSFDQLARGRPGVEDALKECYESVDDIDLFIGGLLEKPVEYSQLGKTFHRVIKKQFEDIRDGDRFWYQTRLEGGMLDYMKKLNLGHVIRSNTYLEDLPDNVFYVPRDGYDNDYSN